jgi:hypothetical protein
MPLKIAKRSWQVKLYLYLFILHSRSEIKRKKGAKGNNQIQPNIKMDIQFGLPLLT